jgi:hypothetical protein
MVCLPACAIPHYQKEPIWLANIPSISGESERSTQDRHQIPRSKIDDRGYI